MVYINLLSDLQMRIQMNLPTFLRKSDELTNQLWRSAEKDDAGETQADTDEDETEAQRRTGKNENAVSEESQEKQENSAPTSDHTGMLLAVLAGVIFVAGVIFWKKKKQH